MNYNLKDKLHQIVNSFEFQKNARLITGIVGISTGIGGLTYSVYQACHGESSGPVLVASGVSLYLLKTGAENIIKYVALNNSD